MRAMSQVAWQTFWGAPQIDVTDGEEASFVCEIGQPLHKMQSYCAK